MVKFLVLNSGVLGDYVYYYTYEASGFIPGCVSFPDMRYQVDSGMFYYILWTRRNILYKGLFDVTSLGKECLLLFVVFQ